jgi:hypothetical protein
MAPQKGTNQVSDNPYGTSDVKTLPRERMPPRKPAKRRAEKTERRKEAAPDISGMKAKRAIRLLALTHDTPRKIEAELIEMGWSISLVTISNIRTHFLECVKLLNEKGLIDRRALIAFRKEAEQ